MTMNAVWSIASVGFNSQTYNAANGGPLAWNYDDLPVAIEDRVADQVFPGQVIYPEASLIVVVTFRDPWTAITRRTKGSLVVTLTADAGSGSVVFTFANAVFEGQSANMQKSIPGQSVLTWRYEGAGPSRIART